MVDKSFIRRCIEESLSDRLSNDLSVYENISDQDADCILESIEMTPEVEYWIQEMVEFEALMNDEVIEENDEDGIRASAKSGAKTGAVIGGLIGAASGGGLSGTYALGATGAVIGGATGAATGAAKKLFRKGGQRILGDQIDRGNKKLQKWKSNPKENEEKIRTMEKKIQNWKAELAEMEAQGKGKAGKLRMSAEKAAVRREMKNEKEEEKNKNKKSPKDEE